MKKLIIPFTVKAHLANDNYADTYKAPRWSPDYTKIYSSALGRSITPTAFTEYNTCLKAGVHLHFILPDAFTHGTVKEDKQVFPAVPNRYIVTRLYQTNGKIQVKCVQIESDYIQNKLGTGEKAEDYTVIPYLDDTKQPYRFMGRCYAAGTTPAPGNYLPKLTALGGGDPMFAAYYPTCRSVFGWYDDLKGVPEPCSLTYFIAGYFSEKENDPFAAVKSRGDFEAVLSEHGFTSDSGTEFYNGCVLFGEAVNIEWKGPKYHYPDMEPPAGAIDVSFGCTSTEAMSAVLSQKILKDNENAEELEYQLTQLQYDLIKQNKQVDGNFKADDEIHQRMFRALNPMEEYDALLQTDKNADQTGSFCEYRELRRLQREAGRMIRELHFTKEKLYRAWETYTQRRESHVSDAENALTETNRLLVLISAEDGLLSQVDKITAAIAAKREEAVKRLPSGYKLETQTAASFMIPKEPAVMVSGDGIFRSYLFGEDTKDGLLYCQLDPQTSKEVPADQIIAECAGLPTGLTAVDYRPLLYQAVLNSPSLMAMFGDYTIQGKLSPQAVNTAPLTLSQLFMDWQTEYYYTGDTAVLDGWTFDYGETGYTFHGLQDGRQIAVSGRIPLTPHALYNLTAQLSRYDQEFPGIYERVRDLPFISQELSGFTGELTGLRQAFQLPVTYDTRIISKQIEQYVENERLSVNDSAIYPMRSGYIALARLNIVGTFGEKQIVVKNGIYNQAKAYFPYYMRISEDRTRGVFPLAFSSPARLAAEFVRQQDGSSVSTCDPGSSPICAVILPELLNNRLILYDENGRYAGMLKTVYRSGKRQTLYIEPSVIYGLNAVLSGFINGVKENPNALPELSSLIQDTLDKTVRTCESAFIWGVPLVLARLRVRLEFFGDAEYSKKWSDFGKYDDRGAKRLKIPLKFGNIQRVTDGTVGVFEDGDFTKCHALWGADKNRYQNYVTVLSPSICAADNDKYYTALFVPNSDMNIETGLFPVTKINIDAAHTAFADKIIPAAEINPIIANTEQVRLPTAEAGFKWRYQPERSSSITAEVLPMEDIISETSIMDGFLEK